eukprot:TRINITY_DN42904_c0_g1_i1.p1 TRINITY_DN42904_c0_g1~~TRINITY_DN42904_c0_g1_i1.p1  ORF type:complete len:479 (-),score=76.24 TRINITY_DN42904_c0_g1_i1:140-1576(-)
MDTATGIRQSPSMAYNYACTKGAGRSHACVPRRVNLVSNSGQNQSREVTTVMIRNVPNQYHRGHFMQELDRLGFCGRYDFVYLPIDRQTQWNVGYAFVNFESPEDCDKCMQVMSGHKFKKLHPGQQQRYAQVSVAHLQGIEDNLAHFQNTAVFSSGSGLLQPWVRPSSMPWPHPQLSTGGTEHLQDSSCHHIFDPTQNDGMIQQFEADYTHQNFFGFPADGEWQHCFLQEPLPDVLRQEDQQEVELAEGDSQNGKAPDRGGPQQAWGCSSTVCMPFPMMPCTSQEVCCWQPGDSQFNNVQNPTPGVTYTVMCVPAEMVCAMDQGGALPIGCGPCFFSPQHFFQPADNTDLMSVASDLTAADFPNASAEEEAEYEGFQAEEADKHNDHSDAAQELAAIADSTETALSSFPKPLTPSTTSLDGDSGSHQEALADISVDGDEEDHTARLGSDWPTLSALKSMPSNRRSGGEMRVFRAVRKD